jgi:hypothetical protein
MVNARLIVNSLYHDALEVYGLEFMDEFEELEKLCVEHMDHDLNLIRTPLEKIKYQLYSAEEVTLISTERTEIVGGHFSVQQRP